MRRSLAARALSILLSLWMVAVLADPGVLHACPEHGAHASHAAHAMHHGGAPKHGSQGCTCLDCCCAAPNVAPPPPVAEFTVSARIIAPVCAPVYRATSPAATAERLLPFANGPPTA